MKRNLPTKPAKTAIATRSLKEILDEVLKKARAAGFKDAFIAGGAIRDWLHGCDPKDIDVFTWMPIPEGEKMFESDSDPGQDGRIAGVSQSIFPMANGKYPVELISLNPNGDPDPRLAAMEFALGIDQAWYTGGKPSYTAHYWDDYRHRTFTVTRAQTELEAKRSIIKINRLWERGVYRHHRLVIAPEFFPQFFSEAWYGGEAETKL